MPSAPQTLADIASLIAADATFLPGPRTTRPCPACDGAGHVVVGYDDCDDVERCLVCRETGRVRSDAVVFELGRMWHLITTLSEAVLEDVIEESARFDDASLWLVLDFCAASPDVVAVAA